MANYVFVGTSIDGYIADKDNKLDWLETIPSPEEDDCFSEFMDRIDAVVMGRNTFETVLGFHEEWPYNKPVFVCSRTLKEIPNELQEKASIIQGTPEEITKTLNDKGFKNLYIDGGQTIQGFLEADLIDELSITIIPILIGGGVSLFGDLSSHRRFELVSNEVFLNQIITLKYQRVRE